MSDDSKTFGQKMWALFTSKPLLVLAFTGIGLAIGIVVF